MLRRGIAVRWLQTPALLLALSMPGLGLGFDAASAQTPALDTPQASPARVAAPTPFPPENLTQRILRHAARDLGIPQRELYIQRYSFETWTDSCLGLGGPAELCALMMVEGWQLEVSRENQSWFYRTDATGETVRRVERPDVLPPSVRDRLLASAARQLNIPVSELGVLRSEPQIWDGCMGIITRPDQPCTSIALFGWRATVQRGEATADAPTWVFHLNSDGSDVRLNPLPAAASRMPRKLADAELNAWLAQADRRDLDPAEVQERVPTEALIAWLVEQWQAGTSPSQVQAALQAANWQYSADDFRWRDVDGDGREEWLLTISLDPNPMQWGRSGDFWIVGDRLLYRYFQPEDYFRQGSEADQIPLARDFDLTAPRLVDIQDYTGDRTPEFLLQREICGAHTCTQTYTMLRYRDGVMQSLISQEADLSTDGNTVVMTYSELQPATDQTGDGIPDLVLYGGTIGSAGAGIQRPRTEIWAWDGRAMTLADIRWDTAIYRPHVLYEANYRLEQGNRDRAEALYRRVLDDRTLSNDMGNAPANAVYDSSRQFAAFRLALMGLMEGDRAEANTWRTWLQRNYPNTAITTASDRMVNRWRNRSSLDEACEAAADYLTDLEGDTADNPSNPTGPTGPLRYLGYANPELGAADVCPLEWIESQQ